MSIEAIHWALTTAPIPTDRKDSCALAVVLFGLANHADPDGRDAFPSVDRLMAYGRVSRRTVQRALRELETLGLIRRGDARYRDAKIERADQRPTCYDLMLSTGAPTRRPVDQARGVECDPTGRRMRRDGASTRRPNRPYPSENRPAREHAPEGARAGEPCGQCDARPGDPISARVIWTDEDHSTSIPCPRCHPRAGEATR